MEYGDAHRFLLRSIASQGVISFNECMKIFKKFPEFTTTSLDIVINDINKEILPYKQEIKTVTDKLTGEQKVVFLSLALDDATKSQNVFSEKELNYFRILLENIMTTEDREIELNAALELSSNVRPLLKKTDAEKILSTWCTIHYLDKNEHCYALGIRAIHEFESYLQKYMPDTIRKCSICKLNVFRGVNCPGCPESIHTYCLKLHLVTVKKWPCCKNNYIDNQMDSDKSTFNLSNIGQTKKSTGKRVREHISDIKHRRKSKTAVCEHTIDKPNHYIRFDKLKILAKEQRYIPRMVREVIEINKHPNFNREDGWRLSNTWDPLLKNIKSHVCDHTVRPQDTVSAFCVNPELYARKLRKSWRLSPTQLLSDSSDDSMDVTEIVQETRDLNITSRKRKRISSD